MTSLCRREHINENRCVCIFPELKCYKKLNGNNCGWSSMSGLNFRRWDLSNAEVYPPCRQILQLPSSGRIRICSCNACRTTLNIRRDSSPSLHYVHRNANIQRDCLISYFIWSGIDNKKESYLATRLVPLQSQDVPSLADYVECHSGIELN